ncbi:MAG: fructose-bisphosphate aldolase [Nitrososphaerota archaeon]
MDKEKIGKNIRFKNMLGEDGRTLIVAIDHGINGTSEGIEDIVNVVQKVYEGGADAVMVNFGAVKKIVNKFGGKIRIIMTIPFDPKFVILAAKWGVDGVKTTYFGPIPLSEEMYVRFSSIFAACEEWEMPWIAEVVPTDSERKTVYDVNVIKMAARIGSELGGDIIKTAYAGTVEEFRGVVSSCLSPIVIMGGPKMESERDVLQMIKNSVEAGAIGGAIGRNIWQHKDPTKITRAIMGIIHENMDVDDALKLLR